MIDVTRVTDALPVVSSRVQYSPVLLLSAGFDASITSHPDFEPGCKQGFGFGSGVKRRIDLLTVEVYIENVFHTYDDCGACFESYVGFLLGWLSALALKHREVALAGLGLLRSAVVCRQECEAC